MSGDNGLGVPFGSRPVDAGLIVEKLSRPDQSLDMASPAYRFRAASRSVLPLWLPGELTAVQPGIGGDEQPQPALEPVPAVEQPAPVLDLTTVPAGEGCRWIGRPRSAGT